MNQHNSNTKGRFAIKVFLWFALLSLFVYSFGSIIDVEELLDPRRLPQLLRVLSILAQPNFSDPEMNHEITAKMLQTIQMGFLATSISAVIAIPISYFGVRASSRSGQGFYNLFQLIFIFFRSIHPLYITIFAIVFAGIGTTAGVLALVIYSIAVLTKEFSEYTKLATTLPFQILLCQIYPTIAFKYLPTSILIATILGFTGGGGIGFLLQQNIALLMYRDAGAAMLMSILMIGSLDLISQIVWRKVQREIMHNKAESI